jgi:hypothetical protein
VAERQRHIETDWRRYREKEWERQIERVAETEKKVGETDRKSGINRETNETEVRA